MPGHRMGLQESVISQKEVQGALTVDVEAPPPGHFLGEYTPIIHQYDD